MAHKAFEHYNKHQREAVPLSHYLDRYRLIDPEEASRRCALPFQDGAFSLRFLGESCRVAFPEYGTEGGRFPLGYAENILILRYLCEGTYAESRGKQLSYNEIPWGDFYYRNFEGRCIKRLAFSFGGDIPGFKRIMEEPGRFRAEPLNRGDAAYRFEFLSGLFMSLIIWEGDEEFPPSSQILFDDNFVSAFTAEDAAVAAEVTISRLKALRRSA
ncbi:MAG: DUF3786 domain-containing protein [Spirochaetaceae bacterium]|jgi:hypothetical protein|nr:DUF3786 domain-containing protein [Spirochaetaceae bacterium]